MKTKIPRRVKRLRADLAVRYLIDKRERRLQDMRQSGEEGAAATTKGWTSDVSAYMYRRAAVSCPEVAIRLQNLPHNLDVHEANCF